MTHFREAGEAPPPFLPVTAAAFMVRRHTDGGVLELMGRNVQLRGSADSRQLTDSGFESRRRTRCRGCQSHKTTTQNILLFALQILPMLRTLAARACFPNGQKKNVVISARIYIGIKLQIA